MNFRTTTYLPFMAVVLVTCGLLYLYLDEKILLNKYVHFEPMARNLRVDNIEHTEHMNSTLMANNTKQAKYLNSTSKTNALVEQSQTINNIPKSIIIWYGRPYTNEPIPEYHLSATCGGCLVTSNRTMVNSTSTGAILFHFKDMSLQTMPRERNYDQYYVYFTNEAPKHLQRLRHDLRDFDGVFNLTMSYKRSSDIYSPYYIMSDVLRHIKNKYKHTQDSGITLAMQGKKRFAAWLVSNCKSTPASAKRFELVEKMVQAGIDIDRRGKCFPNNPPPPSDRQNLRSAEQKEFMASAKFYIAFENSHHCTDYISEKLYENSFLTGSVPIVWGPTKADYEAVVPPHSCIFMDDFGDNMTKLADYLNYLDRNDTAYKEYLNWRLLDVKDVYGYGKPINHCRLCEFINGVNVNNTSVNTNENNTPSSRGQIPRRIVKSLIDWTFGDEEPECTL